MKLRMICVTAFAVLLAACSNSTDNNLQEPESFNETSSKTTETAEASNSPKPQDKDRFTSQEISVENKKLLDYGARVVISKHNGIASIDTPEGSVGTESLSDFFDYKIIGDYLARSQGGDQFYDYSGNLACELKQDRDDTFTVDVVQEQGTVFVIDEKIGTPDGAGPNNPVDVPKTSTNCETEKVEEIPSTRQAGGPAQDDETTISVTGKDFKVVVPIREQELGRRRTYLNLEDRTIVDIDENAIGYSISDDGQFVVYPSVRNPNSVQAGSNSDITVINVESGEKVWTKKVQANPFLAGDKLFLELYDAEFSRGITFQKTFEIQVVDITTGDIIETIEYDKDLVHLD